MTFVGGIRIPTPMVLMLLVACGGGADAEWGGTVTDSAGIPVVHNPAAADWTLASRPTLREELRIGALDGPPEYQFGAITAIDVAADGRIYVLDRQAANVRVFDAAGVHVQTIGRPGNGPGELGMFATALLVGAGDTIAVVDMQRRRIQRFTPDGRDAGSASIQIAGGLPAMWGITPGRQFVSHVRPLPVPAALASTMGQTGPARDRILLYATSGEVVDTLLELEPGRTMEFAGNMPRIRMFESEPIWGMLTDGRMIHGRSDTYRLEIVAPDGAVERVLTRAVQPEPITDAAAERIRAALRAAQELSAGQVPAEMAGTMAQLLNAIEFADHFPLFARLLGGPDGSIWVQRADVLEQLEDDAHVDANSLGMGTNDWDVFDAQARLLGRLTMPPRFTPLRVVGAHIYGVQRDDLDVNYVVRWRVDAALATADGS